MAKVKYSVREYTPTGNMPGVHGFYAEARPDNVISNVSGGTSFSQSKYSSIPIIPARLTAFTGTAPILS